MLHCNPRHVSSISAHLQEVKLYYHGIWYRHSVNGCTVCGMRADSAESALIRHTVQPFIESDDTRRRDNTLSPPEDGHVDARNMSRIVM